MTNELLMHTAEALAADTGITLPEVVSEEALLRMLAARVAALVKEGPEPFYQLMYRLDIAERSLPDSDQTGDAAMAVARLIYDRQLAKAVSRQQFKQDSSGIDPDLKW